MTTVFDFTPSANAVFQFQPTLDGQEYTAVVPWALYGQRPYISIYALNSALIVNKALVGSPVGLDVEAVSWFLGTVTVTVAAPHRYAIGSTLDLTIVGCAPDSYNGVYRCLVTGPRTFTYSLAANPGGATAVGVVEYNVNLVEGYFSSTLVYRVANSQFEVSP